MQLEDGGHSFYPIAKSSDHFRGSGFIMDEQFDGNIIKFSQVLDSLQNNQAKRFPQ